MYLEDNSHQTSLTEQISNHKSQLLSLVPLIIFCIFRQLTLQPTSENYPAI